MTHQPANRPRIAATYASGTVRARRWHGDGDVRGYRPPRGWTARADLTDLHPSRAAPCRAPCGGSSKPRNNEPHRPQAVPPWGRWSNSGRGGGRARFTQSQNAPSPPSDRRRWGHKGARARNPQASKCGGASRRQRFDRAPPQWAGLVWLRPGLLRQVARKRAVPDAGGSLSVRHERRFTDTPPSLASMELPHHASVCGRELRQGALALSSGH